MHAISFIQDLAVIMLIAGVVTVVFHRLKQPVVLGYIVAGFIIGPHTPPFGLIHDEFAEQVKSMQQLETLIEKTINDQLKEAGLLAQLKRCLKVEGIGFLTGARLVTAFQRGDFRNADAFIAFLGMDLRVLKSGQKDGRRSLTKRGDPEARRLLHNAAMSASRTAAWKGFYEEQRARGFSTTQALVMLARKLARVVFALLKGQSEYQPKVS